MDEPIWNQCVSSYFLRLTVFRLDGDNRPIDQFLTHLLPVHICHEIHTLQYFPSVQLAIITFRFQSETFLNKARDYFDWVRSSEFPYGIMDMDDQISDDGIWVYATVPTAYARISINSTKERLVRFLYEEESVQAILTRHIQKVIDTKDDRSKKDELIGQFDEFEKRRKFFADRIIGITNGGENVPSAFPLELRKLEASLPIYARRSQIKQTILDHRVCVIIADTGSGKSTQVPQYLLEMADDGQFGGIDGQFSILCTQPRKVAAVSLAHRVAEEINANVGDADVGYRMHGAQRNCRNNTRLTFTTDSFLLRECLRDPMLKKYNCVIVDEAHERNLYTDLAFGMLKRCLKGRQSDFRIIIMSATIDPTLFTTYFHDPENDITCCVLDIPGRCYPIKDEWLKQESESAAKSKNVVQTVVDKVKEVCKKHKKDGNGGAVLAFLTTPADTELASRLLEVENTDSSMWILQLHGRLQTDEQQRVFDQCPNPEKQRKIVFATNSAETSITIPDVKYVVESGLVKERRFNASRNVSSLVVGWTSKSSCKQRAGRAGRTGPGICYRLYTKEQYEKEMPDRFVPEIQRTNMAQTLLYLFALAIEDPINFDFIEKPHPDALCNAHEELINLGALSEDGLQLTQVGRQMSKLNQVEPRLSRFLIMVAEKHREYLPEACALTCCISVGNIFYRFGTEDQKNMADICKVKFCDQAGDPISYLNVYKEWAELEQRERGRWCADKYINGKCMKAINELSNELRHAIVQEANLAERTEFDRQLNMDDTCSSKLTKYFSYCFNSNLAMYTGHPRTGYYLPRLDDYIDIHPSSALNFATRDNCPKWITFEYMFEISKKYAFNVAAIDETWFEEDSSFISPGVLEECRKRELAVAPLTDFGLTVKRQVLHSKISLEESAARIFHGALCFVENFQRNDPFPRLMLYAPERCLRLMVLEIREYISPIMEELKTDFRETQIRFGISTRICMGAGGVIQDILMKDEYRTVAIHSVPADQSTFEQVMQALRLPAKFVHKKFIYKPDPHIRIIDKWGTLGLRTKTLADGLVRSTENRYCFVAKPAFVFKPASAQHVEGFRILISWCRRAPIGCGIVQLKNGTDRAVAIMKLSMKGFRAKISKKSPHPAAHGNGPSAEDDERKIWIGNLSSAVKDDKVFTDIVLSILPVGNDPVELERASLIREKSFETTAEDLERYSTMLKDFVRNKTNLPDNAFNFRMTPPRHNGDFEYRATLIISDLNWIRATSKLLSLEVPFTISGRTVKFVGDARDEVTITTRVYHVIQDELQGLQDHIRRQIPQTDLKIEQLKSGRIVGRITSTQYMYCLQARRQLCDLLRGDVIECASPLLATLFKESGIKFLDNLEKERRVYIQRNFLRRQIVFYGSTEEITRAKLSLNHFLDTLDRRGVGKSRQIFLKPPIYPASTLKTFLAQNGYNLDTIAVQIPDCYNLKVDPIKRRLDFTGTEDGFHRLERMLRDLARDLPQAQPEADSNVPECSVCFCPVEPKKYYCMEICGHYYCNECILAQLQNAIQDRRYPIVCAQTDCEKPFVIKDIESVLKLAAATSGNGNGQQGDRQERKPDWEPIIDTSLEDYLGKHSDEYSHCGTADCHGIYRKTGNAEKFHCDGCGAKTCSRCGLEFHGGETCDAYAAMKRENNMIDKWYQADPHNRRPCPKCKAPIEKDGGCQHMQCTTCHIHICWRCMVTFDTSGMTYRHMSSVHNSYV